MLGINVGLAAVVLALTSRLMRTLVPQASLALPAMLLALIVCYDLARWTTLGLETVLLTAVFLWLVLRVLSEAQRDAPTAVTYLAAGALGLVRADGILYAGLVWLLALVLHQRRRRVLMLGPLALVLPITQVLFRLGYYGYPLPNTYYLKLAGWTWMDRLGGGVHYVWTFLRAYGVLWLIAAIGIWRSQDRRARALWILALPIFPYSVYVGGDDFAGSRFFAPWVPILLVLAFLTPLWLGREKQPWRYAASLVGLVVLAFLLSGDRFGRGMTAEGEYAPVGLALRAMTSPDTRVANFAAGIDPYLSERSSVDVLGKNDAHVGHQPTHPGNQVPGHNKYDFEYSLARLQPDLVVITAVFPTQIQDPQELERLSHGDKSFAAQLYLDPTFQRDYAASAIVIGRVPIFIRSDSPERKRLMVGECQPVIQSTLNDLGMQRVCWPDWRPPSSQ
jgi:arabinofuranosyltransferase